MHVLIIEDNSLVADLIENQLSGLGFDSFHVATTQVQALELAQCRWPDLITADDHLEEGDGLDAVSRICAEKLLPVVYISGDPEKIRRRLPGAVVVEKPFTITHLEEAIGHARQSVGL